MILYIQPIFIPDDKRYIANARSIVSLKTYLDVYPYDVKIIMGGWAATEELWTKIHELILLLFGNKIIDVIRFDKNYGKAYVVNHLFSVSIEHDFDYFLTCDSDMVFDTNVDHLFQRLVDIPSYSYDYTYKPFGAAFLNQTEQNCHINYIFQHKYRFMNDYGNEELLVFGDYPGGMGGGAVFINKEAWIKIKGYRIMGVYAGDDAHLISDLNDNGYSYQMAVNISMIHPVHDDKEYNKWKQSVLYREPDADINIDVDEFQEKIVEAENFWKNRIS